MSRLHNIFKLRTPVSGSAAPADADVRAAEARVREQEAHVLRLIVQGAPTQFAEDVLRKLMAAAEALKAQRHPVRR